MKAIVMHNPHRNVWTGYFVKYAMVGQYASAVPRYIMINALCLHEMNNHRVKRSHFIAQSVRFLILADNYSIENVMAQTWSTTRYAQLLSILSCIIQTAQTIFANGKLLHTAIIIK